jgi:molybdopterin converting factor small subunit
MSSGSQAQAEVEITALEAEAQALQKAFRHPDRFVIIAAVRFLRMKPGHGEILIAEGDREVPEQHDELVQAFRAQLDAGMWAAVPRASTNGRREAQMVSNFDDVPQDADRVIFFPRAAGGR